MGDLSRCLRDTESFLKVILQQNDHTTSTSHVYTTLDSIFKLLPYMSAISDSILISSEKLLGITRVSFSGTHMQGILTGGVTRALLVYSNLVASIPYSCFHTFYLGFFSHVDRDKRCIRF